MRLSFTICIWAFLIFYISNGCVSSSTSEFDISEKQPPSSHLIKDNYRNIPAPTDSINSRATIQKPVIAKEALLGWDTITGIASSIIALCALLLSIWQGYVSRSHNKVSVRPHLTTWTYHDHQTHKHIVEIINNGIGPAIIKELLLKVDNKTITGQGTEAIEKVLKLLFPSFQYNSHNSYMSNGYVMAEKEKRSLSEIEFFGNKLPTREDIEKAIKRTALRIEYESMYGEKFILDSDKLISDN